MPNLNNPNQIDPLYTIFEQHLYNFQDSDTDRKTFIGNVVKEYFVFLRKLKIVIPKAFEEAIAEELSEQVKVMLMKKIYGCLEIQDYQKNVPFKSKNTARKRYTQMVRRARR